MNLFQLGQFQLNSGRNSFFKIECDALTDDDWRCLARFVAEMVGPFSSVEGVPRGGLKLAGYLEPSCVPLTNYHLIVDDVLTTGNSMSKLATTVHSRFQRLVKGAVIFARGPCPTWIKPLFQLPSEFWER